MSLLTFSSLKFFLAENPDKNDAIWGLLVTYNKKITSLFRQVRIIFPIFAATCPDAVNGNFQQHALSIKNKIIQ